MPLDMLDEPNKGCTVSPVDERTRQWILSMERRRQARDEIYADWRAHHPECYDQDGLIIESQIGYLVEEWQKRNPDIPLSVFR